MTSSAARQVSLVVISAGVSDPSSTRMLADRIAQKSVEALARRGVAGTVSVLNLAQLATDISVAGIGGPHSSQLTLAIERLATADAIVAATPVYKAAVSGLFKSFVDILDNDLIIAKPVVLAATAGSARHALVVEDQLRPLFAFMRTLTMPTAITATPEDWAQPELGGRISRAATELAVVVAGNFAETIADDTWRGHRHDFGGSATRSGGEVELDSAMMRLAAGGSLEKPG
jgi:FMN reductase